MSSPKLVHVAYQPTTSSFRYAFARQSWKLAGLSTFAYTKHHDVGQKIVVPILSALLNDSFEATGADFILYTNSDIALVESTISDLQPYLIQGEAYYIPNRQVKNFGRYFKSPSDIEALPFPMWGADTFLISRQWWQDKALFFPEFLIGFPVWDEVLIKLIGSNNRLPTIAYHEEHPSYWKSVDSAFDPGLLYNFKKADFKTLAIVIPFYCRSISSLRLRNLLFILRKLRETWNGPVYLSLQEGSHPAIPSLIEPFGVKIVSTWCGDNASKARLVNEGARYAHTQAPYDYILQLDADLYQPKLGSMIWNWVRSDTPAQASWLYQHFLFLPRKITDNLCNGERKEIDPSQLFEPKGFGPGGFLITSELFFRLGGMDESFTGWGLEDTLFGDQIKANTEVAMCPHKAFHLYHENDREINVESFKRTNKYSTGALQECIYLASDKVCFITDGIDITELFFGLQKAYPEFRFTGYLDVPNVNTLKAQITPWTDTSHKLLGFCLEASKLNTELKQHLIARDYTIIYFAEGGQLDTLKKYPEVNPLLDSTVSMIFNVYDEFESNISILQSLLNLEPKPIYAP